MHHTLGVEEVGLHQRIGGVHQADAVGGERVTVKIRLQRAGGDAPDALLVFLHGQALRALAGEKDFLGVGKAESEGDALVGVNLRRLKRLRRLSQTGRDGCREENQKNAVHGCSYSLEIMAFSQGVRFGLPGRGEYTSDPSSGEIKRQNGDSWDNLKHVPRLPEQDGDGIGFDFRDGEGAAGWLERHGCVGVWRVDCYFFDRQAGGHLEGLDGGDVSGVVIERGCR